MTCKTLPSEGLFWPRLRYQRRFSTAISATILADPLAVQGILLCPGGRSCNGAGFFLMTNPFLFCRFRYLTGFRAIFSRGFAPDGVPFLFLKEVTPNPRRERRCFFPPLAVSANNRHFFFPSGTSVRPRSARSMSMRPGPQKTLFFRDSRSVSSASPLGLLGAFSPPLIMRLDPFPRSLFIGGVPWTAT